LLRFPPHPDTHWKLLGEGEIIFKRRSIVLRGQRRRPFGFTVQQSAEIALADVFNVDLQGRVVRFDVHIPLCAQKSLQLWAADEGAAREIAALLPQERTPEFARVLREREALTRAFHSMPPTSSVTSALVTANCLVFFGTVGWGAGLFNSNQQVLVHFGSNLGQLTVSGQWWRLFTSMFIHHGVLHLVFNMWALLTLGRVAERLLGSLHYLLLYLISGLCGGAASLAWHPYGNVAGSSGALFGVVGALVAFVFKQKSPIPRELAAPARTRILIFVLYSVTAAALAHRGIDNSANIGGLLCGLGIDWLFARPLESAQFGVR
jgi:rhomboid protease GluP